MSGQLNRKPSHSKSCSKTTLTSPFDASVSNNIVYNNTISNAGNAASSFSSGSDDPLTAFLAGLSTFASSVQASPGFTRAQAFFQNLGGSPDQIAVQSLAGMLAAVEGLVEAALAGAQAVADGLLQVIQSLVNTLQDLLNAAWNIPFVSAFYSFLTDGAALTTLDLIALVVAVPATILYKITFGAAPFPDAASVTAFEQSFTAQTMLQATGLGSPRGASRRRALAALAAGEESAATGILPQSAAPFLAAGNVVAQFFSANLGAILDAIPPGGTKLVPKNAAELLSQASWLLDEFPRC